jgi:K+-sensing histidine kinase KdpD
VVNLKDLKCGKIIPFREGAKVDNVVTALNAEADEEKKNFSFYENYDINEIILGENVLNDNIMIEDLLNDFSTLLNVIYGNTQLLEYFAQKEPVPDKNCFVKSLNSTKQNCLKLTKLLYNVSNLHKIKNDKFSLDLHYANIVEVVENTLINISKIIKDKNIVFDTNKEEKLMLCDIEKIQESILVLLSTAIKFSSEKDILVCLNVEKNIIDITIKFKNKNSKLSKFFIDKLDNLTINNVENTSISLFICKTIINLHGGTISVENNDDDIAFYFNLPCVSDLIYYFNSDKKLNLENSLDKIKIEFSDYMFNKIV